MNGASEAAEFSIFADDEGHVDDTNGDANHLMDSSDAAHSDGVASVSGLLNEESTATNEDEPETEQKEHEAVSDAIKMEVIKEPLPAHLAEFNELLAGLNLGPEEMKKGEPALAGLEASEDFGASSGASAARFPYAVEVECEVIEEACAALESEMDPEAANEMARRLWNHAKAVRRAVGP